MTASLFTGCGKSDSIEQTKDKMKVEAGDTFNFKVSDYFKHSNGDAISDDEYKLDATAVNTDKVGEYTVKVTFGTGNDAKDYKVEGSCAGYRCARNQGKRRCRKQRIYICQ